MTTDGLSGSTIGYNHMDLPAKISQSGSDLAKYSYLANGSKSKAENGSGARPAGYISQLDISLPAARPSRICVEEMVTSGAFRSTIL